MTIKAAFAKVLQQEDINFLLTNRIPRRLLTKFMGWFSRVEQPLVRDLSIAAWRLFSDLDLREAKQSKFKSVQDCFTRELKEGARPVDHDPDVLVSPCDAIVGANGRIEGIELVQVKGFPYTLVDLLGAPDLVERFRDGRYVTLRLTSSMYHRFHAPDDCRVDRVTYISGDTWNVNPIALKRIEKLFCKNERAVIEATLTKGEYRIALVPVAAILVAGIKLRFLDVVLDLSYREPTLFSCDAFFRRGDEMGYFQHGSTIIVFAPDGFSLCDHLHEGDVIRMGRPLLRRPRMTP